MTERKRRYRRSNKCTMVTPQILSEDDGPLCDVRHILSTTLLSLAVVQADPIIFFLFFQHHFYNCNRKKNIKHNIIIYIFMMEVRLVLKRKVDLCKQI